MTHFLVAGVLFLGSAYLIYPEIMDMGKQLDTARKAASHAAEYAKEQVKERMKKEE